MIENNNGHFRRKMKINNEQLKKLLPDDSKWLVPIVGDNFVTIPIVNFANIGVLSVSIPYKNYCTNSTQYLTIPVDSINNNTLFQDDALVCEIYKKENEDIFLELSSLYYNL